MALPGSGQISLSDFNTELGNADGTTISLNSTDVRALISQTADTEASFSDYYGASSSVNIALTLSSNTNNYNIFSNKGGSYVAGKSNVTLTINSGVVVGSTSTGTHALDTGTGWASGDTITIVNNGAVRGRGGNGGGGGYAVVTSSGGQEQYDYVYNGNNGVGFNAGNAFRAQFATTITNNGTFAGGGGGGGGGAIDFTFDAKNAPLNRMGNGGGGGGGAGVSSGGAGGNGTSNNTTYVQVHGSSGSNGTSSSGGSGGAGGTTSETGNNVTGETGGNGGGLGSNGSAGGDSSIQDGGAGGTRGNYATGNSNITWSVTGTRLGGVS